MGWQVWDLCKGWRDGVMVGVNVDDLGWRFRWAFVLDTSQRPFSMHASTLIRQGCLSDFEVVDRTVKVRGCGSSSFQASTLPTLALALPWKSVRFDPDRMLNSLALQL